MPSMPLGGIADSEAYPFGESAILAASRGWREPLKREFAAMVLTIGPSVSIGVAAIGFEIAGRIEPTPDFLCEGGNRWVGYVAKENGDYRYWPTTNWS